MQTLDTAKKRLASDWHRADIVAALHRRGMSLRRLSKAHGYSPVSLQKALHSPYPKAERIIAEYIGVEPQEIWPSRYDAQGKPNRTSGQRSLNEYSINKSTPKPPSRNAQEKEVA